MALISLNEKGYSHLPLCNYSVKHLFLATRFFFVTEEILVHIMARLQTRKFGQAPTLLFLTPRQALSSHLHVFVMILWQFMNSHSVKQLFQVAGARDRTADDWVKSPTLPPTPRGLTLATRYYVFSPSISSLLSTLPCEFQVLL
jgi:hypothetical protein